LQQQKTKDDQRLKELEEQLRTKNNEIESLRTLQSKQQEDISKQLTQLKTELDNLKNSHSRDFESLKSVHAKELDQRNQEINQLKNAQSELSNKSQHNDKEKSEWENKLKAKDSEIYELKTEFEQYKTLEAKVKEEEMKEVQQEVERLNQEIESLNQVNQSTSGTESKLKEKDLELEVLKSQIKDAIEKDKKYQTEVNDLKKKVEESSKSSVADSKQVQQLTQQVEDYKKKYEAEVKKREELEKRPIVTGGNPSDEVAVLQAEVQKWMASAQQLEQLGTEAVQEVYAELEKERSGKSELMLKYEEEKGRREKAEEELLISEQKLQQLDGVMQRLMNLKK